jgi:hypothetical protein
MFMNDAGRNLLGRLDHLTEKTYPNLRWVWLVGDSSDHTEDIIRFYTERTMLDIEIVRRDTGIAASNPQERVRRMSVTRSAGMDTVREDDDLWLMHESDLITPVDIIERYLGTGKCPVAGWVTLGDSIFYDTWAYRRNGEMFLNWPAPLRPFGNEVFEVDSVGSCWMLDAADIRDGLRCESRDVVELCDKLRQRGRQIWVDPNIPIVQPKELWVSHGHA